MKVFATFALFFAVGLVPCHADTVTDNLAADLTLDSPIPLGPGVALELATNLVTAQADSSYAASEPDSLTLSFESVLRAIGIEETYFGLTDIIDAAQAPIVFESSELAIDDRVSVEFTVNGVVIQPGTILNFGDVPVGATSGTFTAPEPNALWLTIIGLCLLLLIRRAQTAHTWPLRIPRSRYVHRQSSTMSALADSPVCIPQG